MQCSAIPKFFASCVNVLADSFEGGKDGPIFKHVYSRFKAQGLIDETNPNNPTVLRKHANEYGSKVFSEDAMQINNMRIDYLYQNKAVLQEQIAAKPNDQKLQQQLEAINMKITQATMHDKGLLEAEKLASAAKIAAAHDVKSIEAANISAKASIEGHRISAAATLEAAREKALNDIKNNPELKMSKDEKWAVDYLKTYKESSTPSPIMAMLAANDPNSPAAKALQNQAQQSLTPETQSKVAKAQAIVDKMIKKNNPELFEDPNKNLPAGLTEEDIKYNMTQYGKTRDEVIAKFMSRNTR